MPIDKNVKKIAVIGPNADNLYNQLEIILLLKGKIQAIQFYRE